MSLETIGKEFGVSAATICTDIKKVRDSLMVTALDLAEQERDVQLAQCHKMLEKWAPLIFTDEVPVLLTKDGKLALNVDRVDVFRKAHESALKIMERIAKLTGADAPEKHVNLNLTERIEADQRLLDAHRSLSLGLKSDPNLARIVDGFRARHAGPVIEGEVSEVPKASE